MDSPVSFTTLFIWAVVIQGIILALVGLALLHRRLRQAPRSNFSEGSASASQSHHRWLIGGALLGAIAIGAFAYHLMLPGETPWYEHYHPRTRPDTPPAQTERMDHRDPGMESSSEIEPSEDLKPRTSTGGSSVRDAVRQSLRGSPPAERKGFQRSDPVLHTYLGLINRWRMESKDRPHSQVLTADSVYDRLVTKYGFKGNRSEVDAYLAQKDPVIPEECGKVAKVDWLTVPVVLRGEQLRVMCLFMRSEWSERYVLFCYRCDNLASFLDAHMRAFDFFGGVFPTLVYRGLSGPMGERLVAMESPQRETFDQFCRFYQFTSDFSQLDEGASLATRKNRLLTLFSNWVDPNDSLQDLGHLNRILLERCEALSTGPADGDRGPHQEEKLCLLSFPETRFENSVRFKTTVGPSGVLEVEKAPYPISKKYAGQDVQVALYYDRVDVFDGSSRIASHVRVCGKN
jgi:hypothetical protein